MIPVARLLPACLLAPLVLLACCAGPETEPEAIERTGPPPSYERIRAAHNERVALLDRFWTRTVVRVDYVDEEGRDRSEQVEGHIQFLAPRSFLMTFDKLGELYFLVGSNDEWYWWFQLGEDRHAAVGRYDRTDRRTRARVDWPVHPLDLVSLLAIRPLPEAPDVETRWTDDGRHVRVVLPARWGSRRILFDPETLQPRRVQLVDQSDAPAAEAELTRYRDVLVERDAEGPTPRVPQRFWVRVPRAELSIKVDLYAMETSDDRPRPGIFDLDLLLDLYRVEEVTRVDQPADAPAG